MSLRRRLLLTLAPLFIAGLVAVDLATFLSLQSFLISKVDDQIISVHMSVENVLLNQGGGGFGGPGPQSGSNTVFPPGTFAEILAPTAASLDAPGLPGLANDDATSVPDAPRIAHGADLLHGHGHGQRVL